MSSFDNQGPQQQRLLPDVRYLNDYEQSYEANQSYQKAVTQGDWGTARRAEETQRRYAGMATIETMMKGGDPRYQTTPIGSFIDPRIEVERRFIEMKRKSMEIDAVLERGGYSDIQKWVYGIANEYKEKNKQKLIKNPTNEEEFIAQVQQMSPVIKDPNEVANFRHMAVKLDQAMKAVDPTTSLWTNPKTKDIAAVLNREAGEGGVGYFTSGEQQLQVGAVGKAAIAGLEFIEGAADFGTHAVHGAWTLADRAIRAMGLPSVEPPRNYVVGPDGQLYVDKAKVPSFGDAMTMLWASATERNLHSTLKDFQEARQLEAAQRTGFENIALGASRVIGMGLGFGLPAGITMNLGAKTFGTLTTKGLGTLGVAQSARAQKVAEIMGRTLGASVANAAGEAVAYGDQNGYATAFIDGFRMAPVLMAFGWMGKRAEHFLEHRKKMPKRMAAAIGGAVEGVGFGTLEATDIGSLWNFIKDPNQSTFEVYAKNMLGMMLFKAIAPGARMPGEVEAQRQIDYQRSRQEAAKKISRGEATPDELASAKGEISKLEELGDAVSSRDPVTRTVSARELRAERDLDIQEMELGPKQETELQKQERDEGPIGPQDLRIPTREEIQSVREMPTGHEKNAALMHLMQRAREGMREAVELHASAETQREIDRAKELFDASNTVDRMIGRTTKKKSFEAEAAKLEQKRVEAGQRIHAEKRAAAEFELGELAQRKRRLERETGRSKLTGARDVEAIAKIDKRMAELRERLGQREEVEAPPQPHPPELVERRILQEPGPRAVTPESLERVADRYERGEGVEKDVGGKKVAELRAKAAALRAQRATEVPPPSPEAPPAEVQQPVSQPGEGRRNRPGGEAGTLKPSGETEDEPRTAVGASSRDVPPTRQLDPTPGTPMVREKDILAEMQGRPERKGFRVPFTAWRIGEREGDPIRTPIRFDKTRPGTLGLFKFFENLTRITGGKRLVTASHEFSHSMFRHAFDRSGMGFREESANWLNKNLDAVPDINNLLVDYPGQEKLKPWERAQEAWAEWHARNLLGDSRIFTEAPVFSAKMQDFLRAPENARIRNQYQRIQQMLHDYQAQGALGRVEASWTSEADPLTETEVKTADRTPAQRAGDAISKAALDDIADLKVHQEKWLSAVGRDPSMVSILDNPGRMHDVLRAVAEKKKAHWVKKGFHSPAGDVPSFEKILRKVKGKERDFTSYLVAIRNAQLLKMGMTAQLPLRDYAYAVQQLQRANPEFRSTARELKLWTDSVVDYVSDSGAISRESAERIKKRYVVYLPFFRDIEGPRAHGMGRGVAERGSGLHRIEGYPAEIKDPLFMIPEVAKTLITRAHQHMVMSSLYRMAQAHEMGGLATIVPRSKIPHEHPVNQVLDAIEKKIGPSHELEAIREIAGEDPGVITLFSQKTIPTGERATIAFTPRLTMDQIDRIARDSDHRKILLNQNQKLQWMEVDTKVYEALMGIDAKPSMGFLDVPVIREILRYPAAMIRFFATGLNPAFTLANIPRDILSYAVFNKKGEFRPLSGFTQWVKGAILYNQKKGDIRRLYEELGVRMSSFYSEGRIRDLVGQSNTLMQKSKKELSELVDKAKDVLEAPENFLRIAEFADVYNAAKKRGASEEEARMEAVEAAREIMVNFARAGVVGRIMNQMVPYFNPSIQGQRKMWRALAGSEGKTDAERARLQRASFANAMASITIPSLFLWWMNKDEEWYKELPQWRRTLFWNVWRFEDGSVLSIPKPFELGVLFGSVPEAVADYTYGNEPVDLKVLLGSMFFGYMGSAIDILPALIKPIVEAQTNYKSFTGRELTPEWIKKSKSPEDQATFYTTEMAKILSKAVNGAFSPIEIEHYLGSYTAGATTSALRAADEIFGLKDHPGFAFNPVNRFISQESFGQSRSVDKLYELSVRLDQLEGSDKLTPSDRQLKTLVEAAKRQISSVRKANQDGRITRAEANRRAYEIAKPVVDRHRQTQ